MLPRPGTRGRRGIWVRVIEYTVTVTATTSDRASTTRVELFRLITTITDPQQATAAQLADCYHQRWESETGDTSLKTHQRGPRQVLRSHDPDGIAQEPSAYLITYQAVRRLMHQAAIAADIDPDRLSFTTPCAPYAASSPAPPGTFCRPRRPRDLPDPRRPTRTPRPGQPPRD